MFSQEAEILRKLRLLEQLKAELVVRVGELFRTAAVSGGQSLATGLAMVVVTCYILGRRMGIDFAALDEAIDVQAGKTAKQGPEAEQWFADYSELTRYLKGRK